MLKKITKGALIGAAALALSIPAQADSTPEVTVHLFGASAQYKFWTDVAPKFLADTVANGGAGCDPATVLHAATEGITAGYDERDAGAAYGENCQGVGDDVLVTYTTFSSINGILSVSDQAGYDECPVGQAAVPATMTWGAYPGTAGSVDTLACADIDIGASDVAGETFGQKSSGLEYGPLGGTYITSNADPVDTTGLESCRPINVPFAFYAHYQSAVMYEWNMAADPIWGSYYGWWDYSSDPDQGNLTRLMATAIFSGQVTDWSDFGFPAQAIKVCLRHAGSGTHATLDAEVLRGDTSLMTTEALPGSFPVLAGIVPVTYFNKGSSDMMKCIREAGAGAIGYADADKNGVNWDGTDGSYGTVRRLKFMGEDAIAFHLINGVYDFWSAQWLYYRSDEDPSVKAKIGELCAYASDAANMPDSRRAFWTTADEMQVEKASDFAWPTHK